MTMREDITISFDNHNFLRGDFLYPVFELRALRVLKSSRALCPRVSSFFLAL